MMAKPKPRGYWKNIDNVTNEANRIMAKHGFYSLPGKNVLEDLGYSPFTSAVQRHHGGFTVFRHHLGQDILQKKAGTWQDFGYTIREAETVLRRHNLNFLPSPSELTNLGYSSLRGAITKYHGGFQKFRNHLGQENRRKGFGVWQDFDYTIDQARAIMAEHGFDNFPTATQLEEIGCSSLSVAISKYHGGFSNFRNKLGQDILKRENGVWKNFDYVVKQVKKIMADHSFDTLPSQKKLYDLGYSSISNAISKYHGGLNRFRERLGQKNSEKRKGIWKDLDHTINEAKKVMEEHDFDSLPSQVELQELGYSSLCNAIFRYHGGLHKFRNHLGQENHRKSAGIWQDFDYVLSQGEELMEEHAFNSFPSSKKLKELGYSGLSTAISRYHGGFPAFREKLREYMNQPSEGSQLESMLEEYVGEMNNDKS